MKKLIDYISDLRLIEGINQVEAKIAENEFLANLTNEILDIIYDCNDIPRFIEMFAENKAMVDEVLGELSECFLAAVFSKGFHKVHEIYEKRNISEKVLADTMSDFDVRADNYWKLENKAGIDNYDWMLRHLTGQLFKIGRLQYDVHTKADHDHGGTISTGDAILNLHIPVGGKMDIEDVRQSMKDVLEFGKKYFPEYDYKAFTLGSWLLDPQLREVLPADSNIIRFADMFTPVGSANYSHPLIYKWIFGFDKDQADWKSHDAVTALQRGAHKLLGEGRWFEDFSGIILI